MEQNTKFINLLMIHGKKVKAYKHFYDSLRFLQSSDILFKAIENIKPSVEVRKVRKGGITYQVPAFLSEKKAQTIAMRWIIESAKLRKKNSKLNFNLCLSLELSDASKNLGKSKKQTN